MYLHQTSLVLEKSTIIDAGVWDKWVSISDVQRALNYVVISHALELQHCLKPIVAHHFGLSSLQCSMGPSHSPSLQNSFSDHFKFLDFFSKILDLLLLTQNRISFLIIIFFERFNLTLKAVHLLKIIR